MNNADTRAGILGGVLLSMFGQFPVQDLLKTILLAATGAVVSFIVSRLLTCLMKRRN